VARGFHRIEKAVGVLGTTEGQKEKYARRLMEDVTNLREGVETVELEPEDLLTGSVELLNEVSAGRIKGEEDRYARTDLYDTNANIEGPEVAFEELKAEVAGEAVTLANDVVEGFEGVYEELERRRATPDTGPLRCPARRRSRSAATIRRAWRRRSRSICTSSP
jgi:iron uptake system component EfeO